MRVRTFPRSPALALLLGLVIVAPFALPREARSDGAFGVSDISLAAMQFGASCA